MADAAAALMISSPATNTLVLAGELDAFNASTLAESVAALDQSATITLDLSKLAFMDSSGLRVLIEAHERAKAAGGHLVLVEPSRPVSKLFVVSGLEGYFNVDRPGST